VRIAYATVGDGPPLVKAANYISHLEFDWDSPVWRHWLRELSRDNLLVRYDERGNGLSDWSVEDMTFDAWVRDLGAVADALGLERFPLLGISQGGPVAIEYATRHPERVSHLLLYGSYAHGWGKRGDPPEEVEQRLTWERLIQQGWGKKAPGIRDIMTARFIPGASRDQVRWFNDLQRVTTNAENAYRLDQVFRDIDVEDLLPDLEVPTLVLHARGDLVCPFKEGRLLASQIPQARLVVLDSENHILLEDEPAWKVFLSEVRTFLGIPNHPPSPAAGHVTSRHRADVPGDERAREEALALIRGLEELPLRRFSVVGGYLKYDERMRHRLKDAHQRMVSAYATPGGTRENHLIWAFPGSGKTHFVREVADSLPSEVRYLEVNLAGLGEEEFDTRLAELQDDKTPTLCFVDEVDARSREDWPYERLLDQLDVLVGREPRVVFVMAGSSGSSLTELKERIGSRPKGLDLLSRVPTGNEYEIPPMGCGDRLLVATDTFLRAGRDMGRAIRSVEKFALYYVALSPKLGDARQVHEFALQALQRLPFGEDRLRYDHLFSPGDPENKTFWAQDLPASETLADTFVELRE
jgi:pimeloyl-ACP methyl ester carboxylesterase